MGFFVVIKLKDFLIKSIMAIMLKLGYYELNNKIPTDIYYKDELKILNDF
tara:strand:- start:298 stop:447 length:150 start_codon:yes stop_codon:yes gene_type:complete